MGLNMNYSLLIEDNDVSYKMPEYIHTKTSLFPQESFFLEMMHEFNNEVRESGRIISEVCTEEVIQESGISTVVNAIKEMIRKVIKAIREVWRKIKEAILGLIDKIRGIFNKKKKEAEEKTSELDKEEIINTWLKDKHNGKYEIDICNIKPTKELLDPNFPDMSVLGNSHISTHIKSLIDIKDSIYSRLNDRNYDKKDVASADLTRHAILDERTKILMSVFKGYNFDEKNLMQSAKDFSTKVFGSSDTHKTNFSYGLYNTAMENLSDNGLNGMTDKLNANIKEYEKTFNSITKDLEKMEKSVDGLVKYEGNGSFYKEKYQMVRDIGNCINTAMKSISELINVLQNICIYKVRRIATILSTSNSIHTIALSIFLKYSANDSTTKKTKTNESFLYMSEVDRLFDFQGKIDSYLVMMNEMYAENIYNESIIEYINEAEGDNKAKSDGKIKEWLNSLISKLSQITNKFNERIDEIIVKRDSGWWKKNKEKVAKLDLSDSKVGDFHCYKLSLLNNDTFVKFDTSNEVFGSDKDIQEEILKRANGGTAPDNNLFTENDTFSQKLTKVYSGRYIEKDKNENIGSITDVNFNDINEWLTKCIEHRGESVFADIEKTKNAIDSDKKSVDNNYENIKSKEQSTTEKTETKTTTTEKTADDNKSADKSDEKADNAKHESFSLADCLGLTVYHEVEIVPGQAAKEDLAKDDKKSNDEELNAKIRRCFTNNITAVTVRMTVAMAAYKQYIGLYKALIK